MTSEANNPEPLEEKFHEKGLLMSTRCSGTATKDFFFANGKGGQYVETQGMAKDCAGVLTRDDLCGEIARNQAILRRTNLLSKHEAATIEKLLDKYSELVSLNNTVWMNDKGELILNQYRTARKLTFWEGVKWKLFGAVPNHKVYNDRIASMFIGQGVEIAGNLK